MNIWCLSAYPQGIQDVEDFVSSGKHRDFQLKPLQSVNHIMQVNEHRIFQRKKNMLTQIQIKPCGLRHETIGLCEKLNSIYIIFYLWYRQCPNLLSSFTTSGAWCVNGNIYKKKIYIYIYIYIYIKRIVIIYNIVSYTHWSLVSKSCTHALM